MPGKTSTTVVIRRKKRHKVPMSWRGKTQKTFDTPSNYGNGWNGKLRKPANQPSVSRS